jgi:hypothetical protein
MTYLISFKNDRFYLKTHLELDGDKIRWLSITENQKSFILLVGTVLNQGVVTNFSVAIDISIHNILTNV